MTRRAAVEVFDPASTRDYDNINNNKSRISPTILLTVFLNQLVYKFVAL
jgi:hypothetical protein